MTAPGLIELARQTDRTVTNRSLWHIVREREKTGERLATLCGRRFISGLTSEVDQRAIAHAGRPVCGNCRGQLEQRLTAGRSTGIVHEPTRSATRRTTERSTMTTTTRMKAPSEALLEPASYAGQTLERLKQERTTINNRLSGLSTQIKRHLAKHATDKARAAEDRAAELKTNRELVAQAIADKSGDVGEVTHARVQATPKTATPTKPAGRRRKPAARRKPVARKKPAPRKKTAKPAARRKTTSKPAARRRQTH